MGDSVGAVGLLACIVRLAVCARKRLERERAMGEGRQERERAMLMERIQSWTVIGPGLIRESLDAGT